ncbi:MAG: hypothetical protein AMXMBFR7_43820 [Planctomycetota bacterium]
MPADSAPAPPREGRCPRCGKRFAYTSVKAHKPFPFCSPKCRNVDLGLWFREEYKISAPLQPGSNEVEEDQDPPEGDFDDGTGG